MRLLAIVGISILIIFGAHHAMADQRTANQELSKTAREFFYTWLVKHDYKEVMEFVSANPILGSCMMPEPIGENQPPSREKTRRTFQEVLLALQRKAPQEPNLAQLLDSAHGLPLGDPNVEFLKHPQEELFQMFRLKDDKKAEDVAYICKFDEHISFRKRVAAPGVYYVVTTLRTSDTRNSGSTLEFLWTNENGRWRILSFAGLEN